MCYHNKGYIMRAEFNNSIPLCSTDICGEYFIHFSIIITTEMKGYVF